LSSLFVPPESYVLIGLQMVLYMLLVFFLLALIKPLTPEDREWLSKIDSRFATPFRLFARTEGEAVTPA
jgi:hypothetical protein